MLGNEAQAAALVLGVVGGLAVAEADTAEPLAKVVWPVQRYPVFWSNSEKRSTAY